LETLMASDLSFVASFVGMAMVLHLTVNSVALSPPNPLQPTCDVDLAVPGPISPDATAPALARDLAATYDRADHRPSLGMRLFALKRSIVLRGFVKREPFLMWLATPQDSARWNCIRLNECAS
jgi:hypothetical protein